MKRSNVDSGKSNRWNLYWVKSDGIEDCFVVARNSRSAAKVEIYENGFDDGDVHAVKIMPIPQDVADFYRTQGEREWPSYVYGKKFFEKLGAEFRTVAGQQEMMLCDVVYRVDDYIPCSIYRKRSVGTKAWNDLISEPTLGSFEYHEEDVWGEGDSHLFAMIGMCLATCQQIEDYISKSFLLGVSKKQKQKYKTLNDLREGWKKKTLGNMLKSIEEAWEIEPTFKACLDLFVANRNRLIHGITTDEEFDIRTSWGQKELVAFLSFFHLHARVVKVAFRASFYASIEFGILHWGRPKGVPKRVLSKKHKEEASLFPVFFVPKEDAI